MKHDLLRLHHMLDAAEEIITFFVVRKSEPRKENSK